MPGAFALAEREYWVLAGDSITSGSSAYTRGRPRWIDYVDWRVRCQIGRRFDVLVGTGVGGFTAAEVLAEYADRVERWRPTIVSYSLGTNDSYTARGVTPAAFRADLTELVRRAQAGGARTIVQTPVDSPAARRHGCAMPAYVEVCREVAGATSSLLVDHDAYWRSIFGDGEHDRWMHDAIHPDGDGMLQLANEMLRTLGLGEWEGESG